MTDKAVYYARLGRRFDAIGYGLIATTFVVAHPRLGVTLLGDLSTSYMLPLAGVVFASVVFPVKLMDDCWRRRFFRLQIAGIIMFGLAPFLSWWLRSIEHPYLVLVANLSIYAAIWYGLELLQLLAAIHHEARADKHEAAIRFTKVFVIYLVLVPVLVIHISFLMAFLGFQDVVISDLKATWSLLPTIVRYIMMLAVLNLSWQVLRVHNVLLEKQPDFGVE